MEEFLNERGLESRKSQVVIGKLKSIVSTLFMVVLVISIITVIVSGLVLIQYLQLLIANNKYSIRTLLRIGYQSSSLIRVFVLYFSQTFGILTLTSFALFYLAKFIIDDMFEAGGFLLNESISLTSVFVAFISFCIFVLSSYFVAKGKIIKEF
jgi:hypothetical protein